MMLGELIERLEMADPTRIVAIGLGDPHAHVVDRDGVSFEPTVQISVAEMLANARSVRDQVLWDGRGHERRIDAWSPVYLARSGCCGRAVEDLDLEKMLDRIPTDGERG